MITRTTLSIAGGVIASVVVATAVRAEGENVGDTQQCISLTAMAETPVIDNRTILVKMRGRGYKRIDLVNTCHGLKLSDGFAYSTSINRLCTSDPLHVIQEGGSVCLIKQIVTIDEAEAKALAARR